tara:strand:- start:81 stop:287 length:207 start_codon:yes stop_codon:yes gene_type:complete
MTFSEESKKVSGDYESNLREIEKILNGMMNELEQISSTESSTNDISNLINETMSKIDKLKSKKNLEEE